MKKSFPFLIFTLSILTAFSVSAKEQVSKIGDELRLINDTKVSTVVSGWHPNFSYESKKLLCFQNLKKIMTGYDPIDHSIKAEAGTIFKITKVEIAATDSFLDPLSFGSNGMTRVRLNSKEFNLELNCHTKEKYYYERKSLANAPTVENVLEIFRSTLN